jgi:hypothetical protein
LSLWESATLTRSTGTLHCSMDLELSIISIYI